ncbi:glycosyltransferase family protein [Formosa algae]|uniref:hypothetical protein n=1 Tax=Formosa algae TaxID=225843 RepID=UPI000CCE1C8B|nr:hypothetical protein [Formosa algae]PNW26874.1 hypothetical protein BKP44_15450 [Formosa algae]
MRKKIDKIYIACYKGDYWQTKICVASIRKWYPDISIVLIKDILKGEFNTNALEKKFNVGIADFPIKKFGWGMSKLEPYFSKNNERCLILDSDIIFLGKLLDYLEEFKEDIIVSVDYLDSIDNAWFKRTYYDLAKINNQLDANFTYPGWVFNSGQLVVTTSLFQREDLSDLVEWSIPPTLKLSDAFIGGDQGILNYFFQKKESLNEITIAKADFKVWGNSPEVEGFSIEQIDSGLGYPKLIHYAGLNNFNYMKRADLIIYYQKIYYGKFAFGEINRIWFNLKFQNRLKLQEFNKKYRVKKRITSLIKRK